MRNGKGLRFDDLSIYGSGANVKGSVELDDSSQIVSANFPVFSLSEGDKVTLKADRLNGGVLHVTMRGDVYDGRNFVKSSLGGGKTSKHKQSDLDLDIKIGTVAGHNGETLRGLDLKLSRRGGRIRTFNAGKIGRDTPLNGDLRLRASDNHQVMYFETNDAGAFFRFTDMYPRMHGGKMWVAMDPPTQEQSPQVGTLSIHDFEVRGEPALESVVAGAPGPEKPGSVQFSEMRADFTRMAAGSRCATASCAGRWSASRSKGRSITQATMFICAARSCRSTGSTICSGRSRSSACSSAAATKRGWSASTMRRSVRRASPRISVNPVSAIAPGLLRKFIPSPGTFDPNFAPPLR